jgi:predicted RNase H-like nuclease (RuvC/YqgF family)
MSRGNQMLSVMLVVILGLWGCARQPVGSSAHSERIHSLESKCAKLEDDYRSVASARDQARKQAATLESERVRLQTELAEKQAIVKERDELRQQIAARTGERDNLQQRCDRLKKGLQTLLGQDEGGPAAPAAPTAASTSSSPSLPTQS